MTLYRLKTFDDILSAVLEELQIPESDTTLVNRIKRDINMVYLDEVCGFSNWPWLRNSIDLQHEAYISSGTVSVSSGSTTIEFSIAPGNSQVGNQFSTTGHNEIYTILSHTAGATTAELSTKFTGSTDTDATYRLWTRSLKLPSDCRETIQIRHDFMGKPLDNKGFQDFVKIEHISPKTENRAHIYTTSDFIDPNPYASVSGLPATSTRASSGLVRTIVFANTLRSTLSDATTRLINVEDRIKITGASDSAYNGEWIISSVSTTTNTDDTITFTARAPKTESSTADTGMSVQKASVEGAVERYRELLIYPSLYTARTTYHVDYIREVKPLEDDDDEPLIPISDRIVLVYGACYRAWSKKGNPEEANRNKAEFLAKLDRMSGKFDDSTDTPRFVMSKEYLRSKRNINATSRKYREGSLSVLGASSSQGTITGTANRAAIFDSAGELVASSSITTTELGYLDGVTSNLQTQLDAITTLADGKILLGNASNQAAEVTPSGDVTISNAGVTAIGAGVIVDADINATAAITRSKIASGTADHVVINSGAGALSSEATLAVSRGGTNIASYTAGDILYATGATTLAKLAIGSSGQTLKVSGGLPSWGAGGGGGSSVFWVEHTLPPVSSVSASGDLIYTYVDGASEELYCMIRVPSTYIAGNQVFIRFTFYANATSDTILMSTQSTLIRTGTDAITSTTNQRTSTNSAVTLATTANRPNAVAADLSDASGQINGVAISAGDLIRVRLFRGSGTSTVDANVPVYGAEVTFS